jgi:nucleotide-binding universal stress UspA family protein
MAHRLDDLGRIVVGVDGSPSSKAALQWAVQQAELTGSTVDAVIAWRYPTMAGGYAWVPVSASKAASFDEICEKTITEAIGDAVAAASTVQIDTTIRQGNPAQVLLDAASGADLLVVGSRGHGGFASALLGSVSQHCVHHARCPVVIIRGPKTQ